MGGRLVGQGQRGEATIGEATIGKAGEQIFTWDGRDLGGQVVPPGIYLCRIKVEADDRDYPLTRVVHVVY
jgi:flagellar hook assembly protein FlgD